MPVSVARHRVVESLEEWEIFALARRRAGVRQIDVARRAGVTQSQLSGWERGVKRLSSDGVERAWSALDALVLGTAA